MFYQEVKHFWFHLHSLMRIRSERGASHLSLSAANPPNGSARDVPW